VSELAPRADPVRRYRPSAVPESRRAIRAVVIAEDRQTDPSTMRIRLEMQGTHVELSSRDLFAGQLLDMGRSLVPLPPVRQ
jgi:hypothetical protein